jgi:hypothetical protein
MSQLRRGGCDLHSRRPRSEAWPATKVSGSVIYCSSSRPLTNNRPRNRDVESRLRNLESLLATISSGGSSAAISLSRRELDQIRVAAHIAPGSDTSPVSDNDAQAAAAAAAAAAGGATPSGASAASKQQQQQQWGASANNAGTPSVVDTPPSTVAPTPASMANSAAQRPTARNLDNYVPSIVFDPFGVPTPSQALPDMPANPQLQQTMYDPNAGPPTYNPGSTKPPNASKGQDLLYRCAQSTP